MPDAWLWTWETSLGVLLGIIIFDGIRWLINALPGLRDWLAAAGGFLPVSGKCARAPLQSGGRRGILFSLEKHLSAIRGQFSSKQSEGTS